jgi:hypothetical protein
VANLRNPLMLLRQIDDFPGLSTCGRQRFFDQHIHSGLHQRAGDRQVLQRGNRDRGRLHLAVSGEELLKRSKRAASELAPHRVRAGHILVDNPEQAERFALLLQLFVDARVVAPERTHTNDRNVNKVPRMQEKVSCGRLPPCRL